MWTALKRLLQDAKGAAALTDWLGSGAEPVSPELAQKRADVCAKCPLNKKGPRLEAAIAQRILDQERVRTQLGAKLSNESDLQSCTACGCYLRLKVWVPMRRLRPYSRLKDFPAHCWMRTENKGKVILAESREPAPSYVNIHADRSPVRVYAPAKDDYSGGYGRLSNAALKALDGRWVERHEESDLAIQSPSGNLRCAIRLTMWEPDAIPQQHDGWRNDQTLIVPCRHNYELFLREGYRGNLIVLPLWGDCPAAPMPNLNTLKFVCVARDSGVRERKRIDMLLSCFAKAFPSEPDVRLTIKQSPFCFKRTTSDPRITLIYNDWPKAAYEKLIQSSHCGVFLSGLESWNFPCAELMACGRPSIVIPYGGPADFTTPESSYHLDYRLVPVPQDHPYYGVGMGAEPIEEQVIETMRHIYKNRQELKSKGAVGFKRSALYSKAVFEKQLRFHVNSVLGRA